MINILLVKKLEHIHLSNRSDFTLDLVAPYTRLYYDIKYVHAQEHINLVTLNSNSSNKSTNKNTMSKECTYCSLLHDRLKEIVRSMRRSIKIRKIIIWKKSV